MRPSPAAQMYAIRGIGKDHAKFSPVATAFYRLQPTVDLSDTEPFLGAEAAELVATCPTGVFDIEEMAGA